MELHLPRILVEGGLLWKLPYHASSAPKRRWFQVKPSAGLLTTPGGQLLVRPGGGFAAPVAGKRASCGDEDPIQLQLCSVEAALPLSLIWVDPSRDLEKTPPREMEFQDVVEVRRGHSTPCFWQQAIHRGAQALPAPGLCFSLIGRDRTLDLAASSAAEAKLWIMSLVGVGVRMKNGELPHGSLRAPLPSGREPEPKSQSGWCEDGSPDPGLTSNESARWLHQPPGSASGAIRPQEVSSNGPGARSPDGNGSDTAGAGELGRCRSPRSRGSKRTASQGAPWDVGDVRAWRRRLFPAIVRGDVVQVVALFDDRCPVDLVQPGTGDTPLLLACRLGNVEIARECLRRGSRNDPHPDFGQTALQAAVAAGQESCVRLVLETAAPSMSDAIVANHIDARRQTPLHVACGRGDVGIVEALLHHGADIRVFDREGDTPLHAAAAAGHVDTLASLIDAGGDLLLELKNKRGNSPLHAAAASGNVACVRVLLETAAEPE